MSGDIYLKKAVAYARYSSDMQREESIEAQTRAIRDFAEKEGYQLVKIYADRGISGTSADRPQFQQMIDDARAGLFEAVIVHKLDRFARNRADSAIYRRELSRHGISLISVLENFDDSPESVILQSVIEGYNEYYSRNLRREVMKGLKENAYACKSTGGIPPLGYDVDPISQKFVVNEYEAGAVRLIFQMYLQNEGYGAIISELNSRGYRTKRGAAFGKNSLYDVLSNEKYSGVFIFNKSVAKNAEGRMNRHRSKPPEEIIRIDGGIPAIISKEDFAKTKRRMAARKHINSSYRAKQEYLLSGKVFCGECGAAFVGNSRRADSNSPIYVSYRCSKKNGKNRCSNHQIAREKLEQTVLDRLADKVFDESILPDILSQYNDYVSEQNTELNLTVSALRSRIKETKTGIDNIVNVIMTTGSAALSEKLRELEQDKVDLENALAESELKLQSAKVDEKALRAAFKMAKKMLLDGSLSNKKAIIQQYVSRITIYLDRIDIEYNVLSGFTVKETFSR